MRGTIALDIDGTIAPSSGVLPPRVVAYLTSLAESGWRLVFITGRSITSASKTLKAFPFLYYLAGQNGSVIIEMPTGRVLLKKYLDRSIFNEMEAICHDEPTDFVVYSGIENQDHSFYRPRFFSNELLDYLERRRTTFEEVWHELESYDHLPMDEFPAVKCFGLPKSLAGVADKIEKRLGLHVPLIRDPFGEGYYVALATHSQINKGQALTDLISTMGERGVVIAAGDDYNDVPMFKAADIRIVMSTAPKDLLKLGDIIAPSASEEGIIIGLEQALQLAGSHRHRR